MKDLFGAEPAPIPSGEARITLTLGYLRERPLALNVSRGTGRGDVWLPKSQIDFERRGASVIVTMTEALAIEKGLA